MGGAGGDFGGSDPVISRLAKEDPIPWYKKPNLRFLYFMLFPTCMGIELTSGFDSQMINALQILNSWIKCKIAWTSSFTFVLPVSPVDGRRDVVLVANHSLFADFDDPQGALKGIISAAYSLGAILSLPLVPIINDRFGRRWSIALGSITMIVGALIQGFSQHGKHLPTPRYRPDSESR